MNFVLQPWQLFVLILASWINRQQQQRIDYLETQCAVLIEHIGKKRILLTDDQRRRLAVKGKVLGRKQLAQVGTLFTPDTILRWHRQLVAQKWDYSDRKEKKPGRPRTRQVIVDLVVRFAKENPTWGYDRISGALSNLGYSSDLRRFTPERQQLPDAISDPGRRVDGDGHSVYGRHSASDFPSFARILW